MTINSDNEKKVFQKNLENKGFRFVELTDYASNPEKKSDDWLMNACQAKVECDILLVSAHFGLGFFGSWLFNRSSRTRGIILFLCMR